MALIEKDLFRGKIDKIKISVERLKTFEPKEGYYLAFSGGKDSMVCYELAKMAGVKFDAHFGLTTVDPKEVIQFTKKYYPDVALEKPDTNMWDLIVKKKFPPTRLIRYCCEVFKENYGNDRFVITGVRRAESSKRSKRKMVENCYKKSQNKKFIHPIIEWTDKDVWEFIDKKKLPYCCLYDEGYKRIGCIGCPVGGKKGQIKDFQRFPAYKKLYVKAFQRMVDSWEKESNWKTGEDVMKWWIGNRKRENPDQTILMC